jgi:hypothetical protein
MRFYEDPSPLLVKRIFKQGIKSCHPFADIPLQIANVHQVLRIGKETLRFYPVHDDKRIIHPASLPSLLDES